MDPFARPQIEPEDVARIRALAIREPERGERATDFVRIDLQISRSQIGGHHQFLVRTFRGVRV